MDQTYNVSTQTDDIQLQNWLNSQASMGYLLEHIVGNATTMEFLVITKFDKSLEPTPKQDGRQPIRRIRSADN